MRLGEHAGGDDLDRPRHRDACTRTSARKGTGEYDSLEALLAQLRPPVPDGRAIHRRRAAHYAGGSRRPMPAGMSPSPMWRPDSTGSTSPPGRDTSRSPPGATTTQAPRAALGLCPLTRRSRCTLYLSGGYTIECGWFAVPYVEPVTVTIYERLCPATYGLVGASREDILFNCTESASGIEFRVARSLGCRCWPRLSPIP